MQSLYISIMFLPKKSLNRGAIAFRKGAIASSGFPRQSKGAIADGKGVEVWGAIAFERGEPLASSEFPRQSKGAIAASKFN